VNTITQTLDMSGTITLTQKGSFSYTTGYDIQTRKMSITTFNIKRDLHCWNLSFTCVPFGERQSWSFLLQPKAAILKEMKLKREQPWKSKN